MFVYLVQVEDSIELYDSEEAFMFTVHEADEEDMKELCAEARGHAGEPVADGGGLEIRYLEVQAATTKEVS